MEKKIIFDKVKWHYPDGEKCPSLEAATKHFEAIMGWLNKKALLSEEGIEIYELGIDEDFVIMSSMLTEKGNELLVKHYDIWLKKQDYDAEFDLTYLEGVMS